MARVYKFTLEIEVTDDHNHGDYLIDVESTEQYIENYCETIQCANIAFVEMCEIY